MGRNAAAQPRTMSPSWPDEPCADADAEAVRLLVNNLKAAMGERGVRTVARAAGIDHGMVSRLVAGETWPEMLTVIRLERGLGVKLWPQHLGE